MADLEKKNWAKVCAALYDIVSPFHLDEVSLKGLCHRIQVPLPHSVTRKGGE